MAALHMKLTGNCMQLLDLRLHPYWHSQSMNQQAAELAPKNCRRLHAAWKLPNFLKCTVDTVRRNMYVKSRPFLEIQKKTVWKVEHARSYGEAMKNATKNKKIKSHTMLCCMCLTRSDICHTVAWCCMNTNPSILVAVFSPSFLCHFLSGTKSNNI